MSKSNRNRVLLLSAAIAPLSLANVALAQDVGEDQIIVTASPIGRSVEETIIGTSIVDEDELQRRLENSIGETLRREPGISSTFFGAGASRPVIRGLGGDRIRVLDSGLGSIDASSTSPDHAVAVDPATAQRVEIVRGAATLLYGSSAAGGVVNVLSGRIPNELPDDGIDGALRIGQSTVDNGVEAAGGFDITLGDFGNGKLVFHGEGFFRDADDFDIPGFAESAAFIAAEEAEAGPEEEEEEEVFGTAENSFFETKGGSAGLSWVFENGFIGVSATALDSVYGIPGGHEEGEEGEEGEGEEGEEEEEGGVFIDLQQRRIDLNGEINGDFGLFEKARIRFGYADYEHTEFEGPGEPGTFFTNEGFEGRFELVDKPIAIGNGELKGAVGVQYRFRDFSAIGEEAFVPPTETTQFGLFALKDYETGPIRFELGGRYESTNHEVVETGFERSFDSFSVSGGVGFTPQEHVFFGLTAFRTERAPSTEELFSDGPHLATSAFELGDPNLEEEVGRGVEATARFHNDRFSVAINGFYTSYNDFIYEVQTGDIEDGLPVFQFLAEDATFRGFEFETEAELFKAGGFDVHADAAVDFVRATVDDEGNENLPRIPPLTFLAGIEANSAVGDFRFEVEHANSQNNVTDFELPTDGYTVLNTYVTLRPFHQTSGLAVQLAATNLNNDEVRLHTSFLKDLVPLPGRNFKISIIGRF